MTDMTTGSAAPDPHRTTEIVAKSLDRRRRKQSRLKWIGMGAIMIAFTMLFILVASLVSTGWQAFVQTHITVEVFVDPEEIRADRLPRGNFDDVLETTLGNMLPGVDMTDRATARSVGSAPSSWRSASATRPASATRLRLSSERTSSERR